MYLLRIYNIAKEILHSNRARARKQIYRYLLVIPNVVPISTISSGHFQQRDGPRYNILFTLIVHTLYK